MKKVLSFIFVVMFILGLCACSNNEQQTERVSMYDIIATGDRDKILEAAEAASGKSDILHELLLNMLEAEAEHKSGNISLAELESKRDDLVDFLVEEGFNAKSFDGEYYETRDVLSDTVLGLLEEYKEIAGHALEIIASGK